MNRSALIVLGSLVSFALVVIIGCGGGSSKSTGPGASGPSFDFTFPATGVSHEFTFNDAGTWDYHCRNHGGMIGAVTVSSGSAVDSVVVTVGPGNTQTFSPTPATIKVGGKVRWVNGSSMTNHTVTRP
jgi:VCBS repeat-containing protein